jgi:hypothetical protein
MIRVDVRGYKWKNLLATSVRRRHRRIGEGMTHGSDDVGWYVHLGRLSAATDGAAETASGLRRKISEVQPRCLAAAAGHQDMGFAVALAKCHGRFSDHFHGHATDIHEIGEHLSDNHTAYTTADPRALEATDVPAAMVNRDR